MSMYGVKQTKGNNFVVTNSKGRPFTIDMDEMEAVLMAARMNAIKRPKISNEIISMNKNRFFSWQH